MYPDEFIHMLSDAGKYLLSHKETLETLYLNLNCRMTCKPWSNLEPISSLKDFTALKTLRLECYSIMNLKTESYSNAQRLVQMLPPNLVSLQILGCSREVLPPLIDMLVALADAISHGMFGRLRRISCELICLVRPEEYVRFEEYAVGTKFASVKVDFGYTISPRSPGMSRDSTPTNFYEYTPLDTASMPLSGRDDNL